MDGLRRSAFFAFLAAGLLASGPAGAVEVRGTGAAALLGNDLTDPENDGVETAYAPPASYGGFDAEFFSSDEPGFEGGEAAFNAFDNKLGPENDKWCCGTVFPQIVGADFRPTQGMSFRLTHFTVSSANDAVERDPVVWTIEGSNDGDCWVTIFSADDLALALEKLGRAPGTPIWTARLQVIAFREGEDYPEQEAGYSMFRMVTTQTGATTGAFFQIGEIEFFGEEADPPATQPICSSCGSAVKDLACQRGAGGSFTLSWKNSCICETPISIRVNDVEVDTVAPDATSYVVPAESLPAGIFRLGVVNCSDAAAVCTPFKTDAQGGIIGNAWVALGPFATPVACDGDATKFLTNHIGPVESIACQFPVAGDPVYGYVPGIPGVEDPGTSSTSGYHPAAPTDDSGNPVWRLFSDSTPWDADLNFEQGPSGAVDEHVQFVATWIENKSATPIDLGACFGSDDDGQVWLDDELIHNAAACRGRAWCQTRFSFTLPPGVHVIKIGVWEQGGDWGTLFGLTDPATLEPVIDLGGILDVGEVVGASLLSEDIAFHGVQPPAGYVPPECETVPVCKPVANVTCSKGDDGAIDVSWENPGDCDNEIRIGIGKKVLATLAPTATSYRISDPAYRYAAMVSVDNGSYAAAYCSLVPALGTGTEALLGNDLTDPEDDGVETAYAPPTSYGGFDAEFFSSDEPGFEGVEGAFNAFDNKLGPGNDKWCCGTVFPQIVGADFTPTQGIAYRLTHFTVSSANDEPNRDPRVWRIEGSNDGETWTTIFSQDEPGAALWTERLQVLFFQEGMEYPVQEESYIMFRMVTEATNLPGGDPLNAFFQVGEIELFGEEGQARPEICDNGIDDDGDRLVDCADPSCAANPVCAKRFERADADSSGSINITDGIFILNYLFLGGPTPGCLDAADTNDDGGVNITDGIYILNFLFLGGPAPPPPHESCGTDPTEDDTGCETPHDKGRCAG